MINKLFFLIFIALSLQGATILDIYREKGMEDIEKILDKALTQKSYWSKVIEKHDTTFGYIEKYSTILVCDKDASQLMLYKLDPNKQYSLKKTYKAFTGKNKGDKVSEGDLRTPVGIYKLVKKLSNVDSFYGPMAFVTSYPNLFDKYQNKNGHGIWIHGLPLNQKREEFTKGCIAIENEGLKCLEKNIDLQKSILLIYETKEITPVSKDQLVILATTLYKWRNAWKYNDLQTYLSFYAPDFKRWDGKNYEQFARYKRRIFAKQEQKSIIFNDINIIPYPNHPNMFQITFTEHYKSNSFQFDGDKELLVHITDNGSFKIFSER